MREILKILAYAAGVVVMGSLLAVPLWKLGQYAIEAGFTVLEPYGFSKYFNRAILIVALGLLWPFLRWLGVRSWRELGLEKNPHWGADLLLGLGIGTFGLWAAASILLLTGQATFSGWSTSEALGALATGLTVAIIEEVFFRGALFGVLRRNLSWPSALAFLSLLFGVLHFIKPNNRARLVQPDDWASGFRVLPHSFSQFQDPSLLLSGLLTLVLVAWILGYSVVRTRSLFLAIGLHAGWVFALRSFSFMSHRQAEASIWFGPQLQTGLVPLMLLGCTLMVVHLILRRRQPGPAAPPAPCSLRGSVTRS